jgi:hypothetical protein
MLTPVSRCCAAFHPKYKMSQPVCESKRDLIFSKPLCTSCDTSIPVLLRSIPMPFP